MLLFRSFLYEPFRIPSESMLPGLIDGDFILVSKFSYGLRLPLTDTLLVPTGEPRRGDVIVFRSPSEPDVNLIKRLVGLPGDHVAVRNNQVFVNGVPMPLRADGRYAGGFGFNGSPLAKEQFGSAEHELLLASQRFATDFDGVVPSGRYFFMGDNRNDSEDSRFEDVGFVPRENLIGHAVRIWMSWQFRAGRNGGASACGSSSAAWAEGSVFFSVMPDLSRVSDRSKSGLRSIPTASNSIRSRRPTASRSRSCWRRRGCPTSRTWCASTPTSSCRRNSCRSIRTTRSRPSSIRTAPADKPLPLFESGAILIYLADKAGMLLPREGAARYQTIQWLMFQMGGIGPMFGQVGFFHKFAGKDYEDKRPRDRYVGRVQAPARAYSNQRLAGRSLDDGRHLHHRRHRDFPVGARPLGFYGAGELVGIAGFPNVTRALEAFVMRPAVVRGLEIPKRT